MHGETSSISPRHLHFFFAFFLVCYASCSFIWQMYSISSQPGLYSALVCTVNGFA